MYYFFYQISKDSLSAITEYSAIILACLYYKQWENKLS